MLTLSQAAAKVPQLVALTGLSGFIYRQARSVKGKPYAQWPAWSTGECVMVALVLNDAAALADMGYTMMEAIDRVDLEPSVLRMIERELQA